MGAVHSNGRFHKSALFGIPQQTMYEEIGGGHSDMGKTIVFIDSTWVTPRCWDLFVSYFERLGYTCLAPTWPYKDLPVENLRSHPPAELAGLGVREIVEHYAAIVQAQAEPPILIGHSFGGLFVQWPKRTFARLRAEPTGLSLKLAGKRLLLLSRPGWLKRWGWSRSMSVYWECMRRAALQAEAHVGLCCSVISRT